MTFRKLHDIENFHVKNCTFRNFRTKRQPIHTVRSGSATYDNRKDWIDGNIEKSKFSFNTAGCLVTGDGFIFDRNLVEYVGKGRGIITGSYAKGIQITKRYGDLSRQPPSA